MRTSNPPSVTLAALLSAMTPAALAALTLTGCGEDTDALHLELDKARAQLVDQSETLDIQRARISELEAELEELREKTEATEGIQSALDRAYAKPIEARCERVAEGDYTISAAGFQEIAADTQSAIFTARFIPVILDDVPKGWRIFGLKRGSLGLSCGLENGDIITEVAGVPMTPEQGPGPAWEAFSKAKRAEISLERRGQPVKLTLSVR